MEQSRKLSNKSTQLMLGDGIKETLGGTMAALRSAGNVEFHFQNTAFGALRSYLNRNANGLTGEKKNTWHEIVKFPERTAEEKLHGIGLGDNFMDLIPKAWEARAKIGKWGGVSWRASIQQREQSLQKGRKMWRASFFSPEIATLKAKKKKKCPGKERVETDISWLKTWPRINSEADELV